MSERFVDEIREHYDKYASSRDHWLSKNSYYHSLLNSFYKHYVRKDSSVLEIGCGTGDLLKELNPSFGVGIDISPKMIDIARDKFPKYEFHCCEINDLKLDKEFDYIIISSTLNEISNLTAFFDNIKRYCNSDTRIIFDTYNHVWSPILKVAEKLHAKMPEKNFNWLHLPQVLNLLKMTGFEAVISETAILFPKYIYGISWILNNVISRMPIINKLCLNFFFIARCCEKKPNTDSVTVCITVRNEKNNIEPLIKNTPVLSDNFEIIFIEGHSTDGTYEEVLRCKALYPLKNVRLLKQTGIGQQDAIHEGFLAAKGDVIFLLEGDMTTPPQEIKVLWDIYRKNFGEFVSGNRLIYTPVSSQSMPVVNFLGNKAFGKIVSLVTGQKLEDSLSGFKGISKKNYLKIRELTGKWGTDPFGDYELIFGSSRLGLKIAEAPIYYQERDYGVTKTKALYHGIMLLKMCFRQWISL